MQRKLKRLLFWQLVSVVRMSEFEEGESSGKYAYLVLHDRSELIKRYSLHNDDNAVAANQATEE